MKQILQKVFDRYAFNQKESEEIMEEIISGKVSDVQLSAFLASFRIKGEELPELTGMAKVLKKVANKLSIKKKGVVDISGTGGALIDTFNISTLAAFVAAAAGVPIAKQIDRSITGKCASADLLDKLGVKIEIAPKDVKKCVEKVGIGFLYAPIVHPAIKNILEVRREIGIRSVFNVLWPLINPADPDGFVIGVYNEKLTTLIAAVLRNLGVKTAYVVHGIEGIDAVSITGETRISELRKGMINTYTVTPEDFNMQSTSVSAVLGGSGEQNVKIAKVILSGKEHSPRTDAVLLNAAAAIAASGKVASLREGLALAQKALYSGAAQAKLEKLKAFTAKLKTFKPKKVKAGKPKKKKKK